MSLHSGYTNNINKSNYKGSGIISRILSVVGNVLDQAIELLPVKPLYLSNISDFNPI